MVGFKHRSSRELDPPLRTNLTNSLRMGLTTEVPIQVPCIGALVTVHVNEPEELLEFGVLLYRALPPKPKMTNIFMGAWLIWIYPVATQGPGTKVRVRVTLQCSIYIRSRPLWVAM